MNIFDKIFYFFYCMTSVGADRPELDAAKRSAYLSKARYLLSIAAAFYSMALLVSTRALFYIDDTKTRKVIAIMFFVVPIVIVQIWFSKNGEAIVKYFEEKPNGLEKRYGRIAAFILLGSFAILMASFILTK